NRKVPIVRIKDPNMTRRMANHALSQILNFQLSLNTYRISENKKEWNKTEFTSFNKDITVGILGLGYIGSFVATYLQKIDYKVIGFKNSLPKSKMTFPVYTKKNLDNFIKKSNIIISILPSTNKTDNFIDLKFLKKMKKNSLLINIGRGNVLDEEDLLEYLNINKNFFVSLDVFKKEPLPKNHKFWSHPNITVTPHVAALTDIDSSINLIYNRFLLYKKTKKIMSDVNFEKEY
ncbi:NAD(P)-binding domain-containing protein, partial [Pelagibacteraceae bacterium]|nr:NAD(P)-binding domain-containing protein [Pelagibacteraceae bacterium]